MGATVATFKGRGIWGALAYFYRAPGYFPLHNKEIVDSLHEDHGGTAAVRYAVFLKLSYEALLYYDSTIMRDRENWEEYFMGKVYPMESHVSEGAGWELCLKVPQNIPLPGGGEPTVLTDEQGYLRQMVGRFVD